MYDLGGGTFDVSIIEMVTAYRKFWLRRATTVWVAMILTSASSIGSYRASGWRAVLTFPATRWRCSVSRKLRRKQNRAFRHDQRGH